MTSSPTTVNAATASSLMVFVIASILGMLVVLCLLMLGAQSYVRAKAWRIKKNALINKANELHGKLAKITPTTNEAEREQLNSAVVYVNKELGHLVRQRGVLSDLGENFILPFMDSSEADSIYEFTFHNSLGRAIALSFQEFNSQISLVLAGLLLFFIRDFVNHLILTSGLDPARGFVQSIGVTAILYLTHRLLTMSMNQSVGSRMGSSTIVPPIPTATPM